MDRKTYLQSVVDLVKERAWHNHGNIVFRASIQTAIM